MNVKDFFEKHEIKPSLQSGFLNKMKANLEHEFEESHLVKKFHEWSGVLLTKTKEFAEELEDDFEEAKKKLETTLGQGTQESDSNPEEEGKGKKGKK